MNATDFIKQHGIEKARKVVEGAPKWAMSINLNNGMYYSRMEHKKGDTFLYDIKRLIESVELVNSLGGVQEATNKAFEMTMLVVGFNPDKIEQAIADYELIYGGKHV